MVLRTSKPVLKDSSNEKLTKSELRSSITLVFMLANTCIGSAMLALSFYTASLGWPLAIIYFIISALFTNWSYSVIIKACRLSDAKSMTDVILATGGKGVRLLVDISIFCIFIGVLIVYIIIATSYIRSLYDLIAKTSQCVAPSAYDFIQCSNYEACLSKDHRVDLIITACIGYIVFMALSFLPSVAALNSVSLIVIVVAILSVIAVVIRVAQALSTGRLPGDVDGTWTRPDPRIPYAPGLVSALSNFPVFFLLYGCQPSIPPLFSELPGSAQSKSRIIKVSSYASTFIAGILYIIIAFVGSVGFYGPNQAKQYQDGNILSCFPPGDIFMTVVRLLYGLVIIVSWPVIMFPLRAIVMDWFKVTRSTRKGKVTFFLIGLIVNLVTTTAAMFIPSITVVFNIISAFFGIVPFEVIPTIVSLYLPTLRMSRQAAQTKDTAEQTTSDQSTDMDPRRSEPLNAYSGVSMPIADTAVPINDTNDATQGGSFKLAPLSRHNASTAVMRPNLSKKRLMAHMALLGFFVAINTISLGYTIMGMLPKPSAANACDISK